jgi:hypothetical protein
MPFSGLDEPPDAIDGRRDGVEVLHLHRVAGAALVERQFRLSARARRARVKGLARVGSSSSGISMAVTSGPYKPVQAAPVCRGTLPSRGPARSPRTGWQNSSKEVRCFVLGEGGGGRVGGWESACNYLAQICKSNTAATPHAHAAERVRRATCCLRPSKWYTCVGTTAVIPANMVLSYGLGTTLGQRCTTSRQDIIQCTG